MSTTHCRESSNSIKNSFMSTSNTFIGRLSNRLRLTPSISTSKPSLSVSTPTPTSSMNSRNTSLIISNSPYGVVIDDSLSTHSNYFEECNNNVPVVINSFKTSTDANMRDHKTKIKIQSLIKLNGMISCGVTGIVGKLDEDRFSLLNDQKSSLLSSSSSLSALQQSFSCGIFDGHGGYFGSEYLSQSFLLLVQEEYQYKLSLIQKMINSFNSNSNCNRNNDTSNNDNNNNSSTIVSSISTNNEPTVMDLLLNAHGGGDILDTLLCESIYKVTKYVSREIKMRSITGSTCVALFIRKLDDGSFRVHCSNTGDSRCVMIHYKSTTSNTSSSSSSSTTTNTRTSFNQNHTNHDTTKSNINSNKNKNIKMDKSKLILSTVAMSEDHKISNSQEYIRIVSKQPVVWYPLPCQAASVDMTTTNDFIPRKVYTKQSKTYPTLSRIQRALILIQLLDNMSPSSSSSSSSSSISLPSSSSGNTSTSTSTTTTSLPPIEVILKSPLSPTTAAASTTISLPSSSSSSTLLTANKSLPNSKQLQNRSVNDRHRKDLALSYLNDNVSDILFSSKVSDRNKNKKVSELLQLMSLGDKMTIIDNDQTRVNNNDNNDFEQVSHHDAIKTFLNGLDKTRKLDSDLDLDSRHHGGLDNGLVTPRPVTTLTSTAATSSTLTAAMLSLKATTPTTTSSSSSSSSSLPSLGAPSSTHRPNSAFTLAGTMKANRSPVHTPAITPRSDTTSATEMDSMMLYTDAAIPLSPSFHKVNNAYNITTATTNTSNISSNCNTSSKHRECVSNVMETLNRTSNNSNNSNKNCNNSFSPRLLQLNQQQSPSSSSSSFCGLNEIEIDELSMHSEGFVGSHNDDTSSFYSISNSTQQQQQQVIEAVVVDDEVEGPFITAPIKHKESFISQRALKNGQKAGPEALFSRHNVSTTMTRSVGDRHAARSCVCTPEITAITIGSDEYARFILGSDGIFDVVDNDKAMKLINHIIDPIVASKTLSKYARIIREAGGLRMDDITCIVVDINPHLNPNLSHARNSSNSGSSSSSSSNSSSNSSTNEWKNLVKRIF